MTVRRRLAGLVLWAALSIAASPATASAVNAMAMRMKALVMVDPAGAVATIRAERARAAALPDARARSLATATTQWLEGEAELRLDRVPLAARLIDQASLTVDATAPRSSLKAEILRSRGRLRATQVQVAAALADFQQAFAIFRALGDRRSQAITLLDIASLYSEANDYQSVLRYTSQARETYRGDAPVMLSIFNNRANALKEVGRYLEAQQQFGEALALARTLDSPLLEAQVMRNIARTQMAAGDHRGAAATMRAGAAVSARAGPTDERAMLALAAQMSLEHHRLAEASGLIARSFAGVDPVTTTLASREAHETAYRVYRAEGNTRAALVHLAALKRLDDEATKLATTTGTALMGARFDFANQELRIASLQRDEARRSVAFERARAESQRTLFIGGAAAVSAIIVLMAVGLFSIRRSRNEVRQVAADLAVSNGALGKALAAKTEFLATTSHEIRTPLNGILGMTQVMLADRALDGKIRDRLSIVHTAGVTMRALVDDILDVAKMETGNLTLENAPYDLSATLAGAAKLWEDQAAAKGIGFCIDLSDCPTLVEGDVARVRQLAFNLLSNALKFTREGAVTLVAARAGDRMTIAVSDTGIGIAADRLEEIFESFRQADAGTTREFGGTGLGLSICRNLAEAMDGSVAVTSVPGQGSTFTVSLPCRPVAVATAEVTRGAGDAMLVIERNPIARSMLRTLLAPHAADLAFAGGIDEALARLAQGGVVRVLADEATLAVDGDAADSLVRLGDAATGAILTLLSTGTALPLPAGWRRILKPLPGARLVAQLFDTPPVASVSDPLATLAA